jgi:tRNA-specific 2-thiouridylase
MAGTRFTWCGKAPANTNDWAEVLVQVRAHGDALKASFAIVDGEMVIRVNEPLLGVAPGQTAVLYAGTRVLGQTTIDRTVSAVPVGA